MNFQDISKEEMAKMEVKEGDRELEGEKSTMYRSLVARGNSLSQDRTDIQFAVKELSWDMSKPSERSWEGLKRLGRYLLGKERYVVKFEYQEWEGKLSVWTDTDYAGCLRTRKSTSGGLVRLGKHLVKSWSNTQSVIALSSGEAEYYGMVKGGSVGLGIKALLADLGVKRGIKLKTDASAAKGIASRRGLGKVRHIEVSQLWLQEKVQKGDIEVVKIPGKINKADALTKPVGGEKIAEHMGSVEGEVRRGRHALMPKITEG